MQIFKLNGEGYFALPEAVNLLNGRPVAKKELVGRQVQENWFTLDPTSKDLYGNSRIIKTSLSEELLTTSIDRFPIKDLTGGKQELISVLKKGNLAPITSLKDGIETKAFAIANPNNIIDVVPDAEAKE